MKKPTVLLYACSAMLSFAASFIPDIDDPRPAAGELRQSVRQKPAITDGESPVSESLSTARQ
jgi:hypothetical protein